MPYSVYFKYNGKKYKLPVNPEEIKRTREMNVETYQVLKTGQVSIPSYCSLEEYSFEAEFPSRDYHYINSGARADAEYYEKMFKKAQKNLEPVRFIASNEINDDISVQVLVKSVEAVEKAGEEGDKYLTIKLQEYKAPGKRYVAVQTAAAGVTKGENAKTGRHAGGTENKDQTLASGAMPWGME